MMCSVLVGAVKPRYRKAGLIAEKPVLGQHCVDCENSVAGMGKEACGLDCPGGT